MSGRKTLTVGVIGTGWIVRAHIYALHTLNVLSPLPSRIRVKWLYGRRAESAAAVAAELGVEHWTTSWTDVVEDAEVDVVANVSANVLHAPVSLAAISAGKHVFCEKPLATDTSDAVDMWTRASRSGLLTAVGFNYRFVPAIRMIRQLFDSGRLGQLRHFRGVYLQDWQSSNPDWPGGLGGSSVLDFSHLFDMLRHLAGEPRTVVAVTTRFLGSADDSFIAACQLSGPATASLEASSCATGWKGRNRIEVNATDGSAWWDMEDFSRLHVMLASDQAEGLGGFRDIVVSEPSHPFMSQWWPAGHVVGWQSTFVHQWRAFLTSVLAGEVADPLQATFYDGLRANELASEVLRAAQDGVRVDCVSAAAALQSPGL
jgi:predicted dehydrogenase